MLKLALGESDPVVLVNIGGISELTGIEATGSGLRIGAGTKMADLVRSALMTGGYEILAQGAAQVGSPQIRHMATVGGNVCNASPSADTAGPLLVLDASVTLASARGERSVPLTEFFLGPGKTCLDYGELVTALHMPAPPAGSAGLYIKHCVRRALDLAFVGVSVLVARAGGRWEARIALSAVAPTPIRAVEAERFLSQASDLGASTIREAARLAEEATQPISDVRASAAYRRAMVRELTERALAQVSRRLA